MGEAAFALTAISAFVEPARANATLSSNTTKLEADCTTRLTHSIAVPATIQL